MNSVKGQKLEHSNVPLTRKQCTFDVVVRLLPYILVIGCRVKFETGLFLFDVFSVAMPCCIY